MLSTTYRVGSSETKCLGQYEVVGFHVVLYTLSLEPSNTKTSWRSFQPSGGNANRIFLASKLLSIGAICQKRETPGLDT